MLADAGKTATGFTLVFFFAVIGITVIGIAVFSVIIFSVAVIRVRNINADMLIIIGVGGDGIDFIYVFIGHGRIGNRRIRFSFIR